MLYENELNDVKNKIKNIVDLLLKSNAEIINGVEQYSDEKSNKSKLYIKNINSKINSIDNDIIKIFALYSPEARVLRQVVSYFKITNDLLRIASNTRSFIRGINDIYHINNNIMEDYVLPMHKSTVIVLETIYDMFDIDCEDELRDKSNKVLIEQNKIEDLYEILEENLFSTKKDYGEFEKFHLMLKTLRKSEKIADRGLGIANLLLYVQIGGDFHIK